MSDDPPAPERSGGLQQDPVEQFGDAEAIGRSAVRGSSLLVAGRGVALVTNFAAQAIIVRYLAKAPFGVFAYGQALADVGEMAVTFGLRRGVARFLPIYDEQGEHSKAVGLLLLSVGTILALSAAGWVTVYGLRGVVAGDRLDAVPEATTVIALMVLLVPVKALENLADSLLAVFNRPRALAVRKYVLAPGIRVAVAVALVLAQASVVFAAAGFVVGGALGILVYAGLLIRIIRDRGWFEGLSLSDIRVPYREVLAFTMPLLTTEILLVSMHGVDAVMLGQLRGADEVASLRAILPLARTAQVVLLSFAALFTPFAARLYARGDHEGLDRVHWQAATWVAFLSFPIFVGLAINARPVTVLAFGDPYASSDVLLLALISGYFLNALTAFNEVLLSTYARLRYIVAINVATAAANVTANLLLIPRIGALGAAVATAGSLLLHNVLKQWGLRRLPGQRAVHRELLAPYGVLLGGAVLAAVIGLVVVPPLWWGGPLAAVFSLGVLRYGRRWLGAADIFPELRRFALTRWLLR